MSDGNEAIPLEVAQHSGSVPPAAPLFESATLSNPIQQAQPVPTADADAFARMHYSPQQLDDLVYADAAERFREGGLSLTHAAFKRRARIVRRKDGGMLVLLKGVY